MQHFGNRHDFYEPPAYNLDALLANNYCAAASLFDRRMFDAGIHYAEDIVFGHEDWDLVLEMAEHGIEGEAAENGTLWYRKRGFSRVNAAEYGPESFNKHIEQRHPTLYRQRREQIKARWAPALSIILATAATAPTNRGHQDCRKSSQIKCAATSRPSVLDTHWATRVMNCG